MTSSGGDDYNRTYIHRLIPFQLTLLITKKIPLFKNNTTTFRNT